MSIKYKTVTRINPNKPGDPARYFASPVYKDKLTLRRIAKEIAERTSLSSTDTMAVLEAMTQVVPDFLADGNIIYLGDFGTFRITLHSEGTDKPEDFTASNVNNFRLNFRPGREFSDKLKNLEAVKA
jgi:predicted histone-like DNA-binding protein